uniref:Uncharacterized protein n=1 Tax=Salix viminalis TaxID=40686 RepID=A0A6N2MYD7_SALVM
MLSSEISLPQPKQPVFTQREISRNTKLHPAVEDQLLGITSAYSVRTAMRASYGFWKKKTMDWPSLQLLPHSSLGLAIKDGKTREKKSMA